MSRGVGGKWVQEGSDLGGVWGRWQTITGWRCCNWQWVVWRGGLSVWPHCMMSSVDVSSCWTSVNIYEHKVMAGTWGWKQTVGRERMRVCVGVWVGERERGECVCVCARVCLCNPNMRRANRRRNMRARSHTHTTHARTWLHAWTHIQTTFSPIFVSETKGRQSLGTCNIICPWGAWCQWRDRRFLTPPHTLII